MNRIQLRQGSPEWIAWRRGGLGGSDIAAILGLSPYEDATRESVFAAKVNGTEREPNFAMRRGSNMEPHARFAYELRRGCSAPPVCVEMAGCDWARVSLDGLCTLGGQSWVLELKAPSWKTHDLALAGIVPEHFEVQIQWQLLVTGLDCCDYASFNPSSRFTPASFGSTFEEWAQQRPEDRERMPAEWLAIVPMDADVERQAWIMEEAARFWFEVAEARASVPAAAPVGSRFGRSEAEFL